jgi:2-hydroxy-3-keto-5-methylthiopentenyl-1-phosphate phosphatase
LQRETEPVHPMDQSFYSHYSSVLVSDFDGTMTRRDFFKLAIQQLLPPDGPDHWSDYRAGQITHFEALRLYFAEIRATEAEVIAVVDQMELDPGLPQALSDLQRAGWKVVVTSAGCDWYIRRLLAQAGVALEIHSNPGRFVPGLGLWMEMPIGSPFLSPTLGIDKAQAVRHILQQGSAVAFAGDGFPDEEAAMLVPAELRFARNDLANVLARKGESFQPFDTWSQIPQTILSGRS